MTENAESKGGVAGAAESRVAWQRRDLPYTAVKMLADEVVVHLASRFRLPPGTPVRTLEVDIPLFTDTLLHDTMERALEMIRQERRDGVPIEVIYLHTLAGAARRMGEMWDRDELSFLDMTVATGRIFSIMRELRIEARSRLPKTLPKQHALFATVPGEDHLLGVTMAADLMRERGWQITLRTGKSHESLLESIENEHHMLIGLSASPSANVVAMTRLIVALRIVQPWAYIFVSGGIVDEIDDLKDVIGVDSVLRSYEDIAAAMDVMVDLPPRSAG